MLVEEQRTTQSWGQKVSCVEWVKGWRCNLWPPGVPTGGIPSSDSVSTKSRQHVSPNGRCKGNVFWRGSIKGFFFPFSWAKTVPLRVPRAGTSGCWWGQLTNTYSPCQSKKRTWRCPEEEAPGLCEGVKPKTDVFIECRSVFCDLMFILVDVLLQLSAGWECD